MGKFYKMIDLSTDELKKSFYEILDSKKSMQEVYEEFGLKYSPNNSDDLKELAKEVDFDLSVYKERQSKPKKYCLQCGKELVNWQTKFCSSSCSATYNNLRREPRSQESRERISKIINNLPKNKRKYVKSVENAIANMSFVKSINSQLIH